MEFDITIEGTKLRVIADLTPCNDLDFVSVYPLDSQTEIYGLLDERFQRKIDGAIYERIAEQNNKSDVWADLHDDEAN
jgi:hypothetical protein